jgi:hypothetical protein
VGKHDLCSLLYYHNHMKLPLNGGVNPPCGNFVRAFAGKVAIL